MSAEHEAATVAAYTVRSRARCLRDAALVVATAAFLVCWTIAATKASGGERADNAFGIVLMWALVAYGAWWTLASPVEVTLHADGALRLRSLIRARTVPAGAVTDVACLRTQAHRLPGSLRWLIPQDAEVTIWHMTGRIRFLVALDAFYPLVAALHRWNPLVRLWYGERGLFARPRQVTIEELGEEALFGGALWPGPRRRQPSPPPQGLFPPPGE